jgi:hypothetical protein
MCYIEDSDGEVVDGFRATIRQIAHQIFFLLANNDMVPKTWGVAGAAICKQYNTEMAVQVQEMCYCADSWKAHYLATQIYPSWYASHGNKVRKVKSEDLIKSEGVSGNNLKVTSKCSSTETSNLPTKKARKEMWKIGEKSEPTLVVDVTCFRSSP